MAEQFPLYTAHGSYHEPGRQHGQQAGDRNHDHLDSVQRSTGVDMSMLAEHVLYFAPLFQKHCPHLLEDIEGLAEGAGITLAGAARLYTLAAMHYCGIDE